MNILGFLSVIVVCITCCIITVLICKLGIKIHRKYEDVGYEADQHVDAVLKEVTNPQPTEEDVTKLEEEINKDRVAKSSMDAVIRSCNELMGIDIEEVNNEGK